MLGIVGSLTAAHLVRSRRYEMSPLDPSVFLFVMATMSLVATAACAPPAWRASRLDPMTAFRTE
jgi:ABC-type antimicrobial peptide transport system permease subunit